MAQRVAAAGPGRRRNGQGTIEWSRDGRGYVTARGRLRYRGAYYTTGGVGVGTEVPIARKRERLEREIDRRIAALKALLDDGRKPDRARERRPLIRQLVLWLEAAGARTLPHTRAEYARVVESRIRPYPIARLPLGQLQPEDVDAWLAALRADGVSSHQVKYVYERLLECLRALEADGAFFPGVRTILASAKRRRPRHRKQPIRPLDEAELQALLTYCRSQPAHERHGVFADAFGLNVYMGLRFSELAALPWGEVHGVDWAADAPPVEASVTVRWQLDRETRKPRQPKSEAGVRAVPLDEEGAAWFRDLRRREVARGRACRPDQLVFVHTSRRGGTDRELGYAAARRHLAALCDAAGLTASGKTHAVRRGFGTLAASANVPLPALQKVMGHADRATTLIYTEPLSADVRRVGRAVGQRLRTRATDPLTE